MILKICKRFENMLTYMKHILFFLLFPFKISKVAKFGREMLLNAENVVLQSLQILYVKFFVLHAVKIAIFHDKVVELPDSNREQVKF